MYHTKKCQTRRYQNKHNLLLKTLDYQIIVQINTAKSDLEDKRPKGSTHQSDEIVPILLWRTHYLHNQLTGMYSVPKMGPQHNQIGSFLSSKGSYLKFLYQLFFVSGPIKSPIFRKPPYFSLLFFDLFFVHIFIWIV